MMEQHDRSESLFYYFRIEDEVPESHLLRLIDHYVLYRATLGQHRIPADQVGHRGGR